jgi:hypothetical protein
MCQKGCPADRQAYSHGAQWCSCLLWRGRRSPSGHRWLWGTTTATWTSAEPMSGGRGRGGHPIIPWKHHGRGPLNFVCLRGGSQWTACRCSGCPCHMVFSLPVCKWKRGLQHYMLRITAERRDVLLSPFKSRNFWGYWSASQYCESEICYTQSQSPRFIDPTSLTSFPPKNPNADKTVGQELSKADSAVTNHLGDNSGQQWHHRQKPRHVNLIHSGESKILT